MKKKIIASVILASALVLGVTIKIKESVVDTDVKAVYVMISEDSEDNTSVMHKGTRHWREFLLFGNKVNRNTTSNSVLDNIREKVATNKVSVKEDTNKVETEIIIEDTINVVKVSYEMYSTTSLNVRNYPSTDGNVVGVLSLNEKVEVTGEVDNGWVRISYEDSTAYVKADYLSKEKIVVSAPVATTSNTTSSEASGTTVIVGKEGTFDISAGQAAVDLVNEIRAENGLGTLTWDDALYESAKVRAAEASIVWSHTRPDGSSWSTVSGVCQGENLAKGFATAQEAVDGWMTSQGHKDNILRDGFTRTAVAFFCTENGWFWCEHFGY